MLLLQHFLAVLVLEWLSSATGVLVLNPFLRFKWINAGRITFATSSRGIGDDSNIWDSTNDIISMV